jgi:anion-transporting  ArsA/GET3 family ATPase
MTVNNLIYKLTKYFSWLYFRHWERWELLTIVLISLILLLLLIWQHRRGKTRNIYVNQIRERSPIIGVKLADNRSHLKIEDLKKDRLALLHKTSTKQKKTKEQLEKLNKQIQLLQFEISKHKQNEVRLEQQVTELTTANKKLQQKAVVNNQVEQHDKQQPEKVSASKDKLQQKMSKSKQAEQYPKRQIFEMPAVNEQPQHELAKSIKAKQQSSRQSGDVKSPTNQSKHRAIKYREPNWMHREKTQQERISRESSEQPLDVEKLKALADLAKQIRGQHR